MKPGVYDITIEQYHGGPGLSRSSLMEFQKTPFHYHYKIMNPEIKQPIPVIKKINALEFGNAFHTYVLEPNEFEKRYHIMPKVNRATKAGKQLAEIVERESNGKALICKEAFNEIQQMSDAIHDHAEALACIKDAVYEKSIFWNDPETALLCKVRPDIWHSNFVCDLKTCQSASYRDFQQSLYGFGYHIQAAMIREGLWHALNQNVRDFVYVAVEKEAPYAVAVYYLDQFSLEHGILQFKRILKGIRDCLNANTWPSYKSDTISIPRWAFGV